MITAKIDVTKIDKSKLFVGKNGAKYLDIVLFETPGDKYGNDYRVVQGVTKEDRSAGIKGAILGNGTVFTRGNRTAAPKETATGDQFAEVAEDDVPF